MSPLPAASSIPSHVPPELVRPYPYILGNKTDKDPFSFISTIHEGPDIFLANNGFMGHRPAWIVRRATDLQAIYFDNEHFSVKDFAPFSQFIGESWQLVPAEIDPPRHPLYRMLMNPIFSPKQMGRLEDKIRLYAREYIDAFRQHGECEFMSEFAFEFPIKVFLELMGLPMEKTPLFLAWEHQLLHEADLGAIANGTRSAVDYLRGEMEERRRKPREDLISFALQAEVEGRKLNEDELMGFCFNLFIGGLDTVSTNMGLQFRHLAENPEHQEILRAHPEMIPDAIDELMRAYAAVTTFRTCIKETKIHGVTIMPGDKVAMTTHLAGRDPEMYDRPNEIILERKPKHVSFGYGIHLCVGMHLARRELRIAMEEFLARIPRFGIAPGATVTSYLAAMIRPVGLPLVWSS